MKILIIRNYPSYMDVEKNTYNIQEVGLAKAFVRKGNICDIIFWTDKKEKKVELLVDNYGTVNVYYRHGKTALKNTIYTGCDELFNKYDILQTAEYNQMQSWILAKKYPTKLIVYHGPYYSKFNKRYNLMCSLFDRIFLKRYLKTNTHFITKSNLATEFLKTKGIKKECICTIGVGIDRQMLSNKGNICKEPLYLRMKQDRSLKLLYIGRFEERRNVPFILEVLSKVLEKNSNTILYMIGTGNKDYIKNCWQYADKMGIRKNIVYQERIEQKYLSLVYRQADFFLLPTSYEIFGMVLLEAMNYGTIPITTDNGGSEMLISDKLDGYIEKNLDSEVWSKLIINTSADKCRMQMMKENAKNKISDYTWDALETKFEDAYRKRLI